jgi:hypothetical protein
MNRNASYALILALTLLIVLPVIDSVNTTVNHNISSSSMLLASGSPAIRWLRALVGQTVAASVAELVIRLRPVSIG